ncbi:hypothetical protein [Gottfriedia acidiceleris]|uniref:hypothetical protein n=1 Tax=Gottfriedia acidiceleris TaxID=371036 RepID=UPI003000BCE8
MKVPVWGLILQLLFILFNTVFNFLRIFVMDHYSVYPVALFELSLGLSSVFCGIVGIWKREKPLLSVFVILFGILICCDFVFIYLLFEAGIPPAIPWLYSK